MSVDVKTLQRALESVDADLAAWRGRRDRVAGDLAKATATRTDLEVRRATALGALEPDERQLTAIRKELERVREAHEELAISHQAAEQRISELEAGRVAAVRRVTVAAALTALERVGQAAAAIDLAWGPSRSRAAWPWPASTRGRSRSSGAGARWRWWSATRTCRRRTRRPRSSGSRRQNSPTLFRSRPRWRVLRRLVGAP